MRETGGDGVEQHQVGVESAGVDEDDGGGICKGRPGIGVDDPDPGSLSLFLVVDNGVYHGKWPEGQITGTLGPGYRRGIAIVITAEGATSLTERSILTLAPTL